MLQSCETLITKINEWQKAILELEKLSEKFLSSGDDKVKSKIKEERVEIKVEIEKKQKEYLALAYLELDPDSYGDKTIFWPEKELLENLYSEIRMYNLMNPHIGNFTNIRVPRALEIKNNHVITLTLSSGHTTRIIDVRLFQNLKVLTINYGKGRDSQRFLRLPKSIKQVCVEGGDKNLLVEYDLANLENLEVFNFGASPPSTETLLKLPKSIKGIIINRTLSDEEKRLISEKYLNIEVFYKKKRVL